jgi:uncharacterized protein (TIGR03067 family)
MRRRTPWTLVVGLLVAVAAAAAEGPDKSSDPALDGDWDTVSFLRGGAPLPREKQFPDRLMTIRGDTFSEKRNGKVAVRGKLKIDTAKSPRWMDTTFLEGGPGLNETVYGIYEVNGDTLRVCCAASGEPRPTAFESKTGTGLRLIVYKRHKPEP